MARFRHRVRTVDDLKGWRTATRVSGGKPSTGMHAADLPRHCAGCGERIGVYEPLWLEQPDGTFSRTSLLNVSEHQQDGRQLRLFHSGCLAADNSRAGSAPGYEHR
jgi:hypothetical protein